MPKTGTPAPNIPSGTAGAPAWYTDDGPPDKMIAFGRLASISLTGIVDGTISEYTWHSRTRRAISCAYCAPKSTTNTVSNAPDPGTFTAFYQGISQSNPESPGSREAPGAGGRFRAGACCYSPSRRAARDHSSPSADAFVPPSR